MRDVKGCERYKGGMILRDMSGVYIKEAIAIGFRLQLKSMLALINHFRSDQGFSSLPNRCAYSRLGGEDAYTIGGKLCTVHTQD